MPILIRRAFHDGNTPPTEPVFLALPMDIMEEMTSVAIAEVSTIDRAAVAGSLDRLADSLAAIPPGKLAILPGDEISASNAAPETVRLAEAFGAPVFRSSWLMHIPFPTSHPLWAGDLPTKASEIAQVLRAYDAAFALGGKSLITILYTEGSAVPTGCDVFHMSADVRNLGRTYATKLAVVGDIKTSLAALLPLLTRRLAGREEAYAALREVARREQTAPCCGGRCGVRRAGHLPTGCRSRDGPRHRFRDPDHRRSRCHLDPPARLSERHVDAAIFLLAGRSSAGVCRQRSASRSALIAHPSFRSSAMARHPTRHRRFGPPRTKSCR
jgi:hypothetical protein